MADPPPPPDPDDPLAPARGLGLDGLLALLERLDGADEAARRARGRWRPACPTSWCVEEVQREVERRLVRTRQFYDEQQW